MSSFINIDKHLFSTILIVPHLKNTSMERISFFILCLICFASPISQGVELVVNSSVPISSLSATEARNIFTMRTQQWPDGQPIKVFVLNDDNSLHKQFSKENLRVFPYKLRRIWDRNIYSGTGNAPITLDSEEEMIEVISTLAGSIGYANKGGENVRLIKIQ